MSDTVAPQPPRGDGTGLPSFLLAVPAAAVTAFAGWGIGKLAGTNPDVAFLRWEGVGTIVVNGFSIFAFWLALFELWARSRRLAWEERAFEHRVLPEDAETVIDKAYIKTVFQLLNALRADIRKSRLARTIELCASKYQTSSSVSEVSESARMHIENDRDRSESSYSLVRYLAWAIPSIGFIGTVMGLSSALGRFGDKPPAPETPVSAAPGAPDPAPPATPPAAPAVAEKKGADALMDAVTRDLMLAFNTTFVALVLSLLLMYRYHGVTAREDAQFNRISDYCLRFFIAKAYYPPRG